MAKYRKRPIVVEAVQWLPDKMLLADVINAFGGIKNIGARTIRRTKDNLIIKTLEGDMVASPGDWIIKGISGELYPCKPDIFEQTYEKVK